MRARLGSMAPGQEFTFLSVPKMAEQMDRVVDRSGGEIFAKDVRPYGVVISVRKLESSR